MYRPDSALASGGLDYPSAALHFARSQISCTGTNGSWVGIVRPCRHHSDRDPCRFDDWHDIRCRQCFVDDDLARHQTLDYAGIGDQSGYPGFCHGSFAGSVAWVWTIL